MLNVISKVFQISLKIVIGIIFSLGVFAALTQLFASFAISETGLIYYLVILCVVVSAATAPTFRRAFGRSFLLLGVAIFMLPISTLVFSGTVVNETIDTSDSAAVVGGVIACGLMTMFAGFVGFFLGTVSLILGLVLSLGGRREVIIVESRLSETNKSRSEPTFK